MITTPNLGLKVWNLTTDVFDSAQLADNWARVDEHDHTPGKGEQITAAAIANGAVQSYHLNGAVTATPSDNSVTLAKLHSETTTDYGYAFSTYKTVTYRSAVMLAATVTAAGTYVIGTKENAAEIVAPAGVGHSAIFYLDPASYTAGSRTTKYRVEVTYVSRGVTTGRTTTFGLYPVTSVATGVITPGVVTSGSTVAFANPAINTLSQSNSGDFTAPAAGYYFFGAAVAGGAFTASSDPGVSIRLTMRQT
jgi:hypothetical protein